MSETTNVKQDATMVCVTAQLDCERLIKVGREIADQYHTKLYVVNVQEKGAWGNKFCKEIEHLFEVSKSLNGEMLIYFSNHPIETLKNCIERNQVKHVILGQEGKQSLEIAEQLHSKAKDFKTYICSKYEEKEMLIKWS